jgi:hypothetical protein
LKISFENQEVTKRKSTKKLGDYALIKLGSDKNS